MRLLSLLLAATFLTAHAQRPEISADIIIPQPPPSAPAAEWKNDGIRTTVSTTLNGVELKGFHYAASDPKAPEVLFFNGNGMVIARIDRFYRLLAGLGCNVTVYDYRGYGFTAGKAHLATFREDGLQLYDALLKASPGSNVVRKVVVYGASMGTTVAAYIASKRPLAGLVLGMPIASVKEEFPVYGKLLGFTDQQLAGVTYSAEADDIFGETQLVKDSKAPLLVLGGEKDTLVPDIQAKAIFAASTSPAKQFVEVPGAGHNDVIASPQGLKALAAFLKQLP